MRFVLDGEPFDIDASEVRDRLRGHEPEEIREYWVEIDGRRWPVKQALRLATGVSRTRFQSQTARRLLARLGFEVNATPAGRRTASARPSQRAAQTVTLEPLERVDMSVSFTWMRAGLVLLDPDGFPRFPPLPAQAGLYRFDFGLGNAGVRTLYIGESMDLRRRASNYRNAKTDRSRQRTSRRIHKELVAHLASGGSIEFAIAVDVSARADAPLDLKLRSVRRLAENAAVVLAQQEANTRVLNIDADLTQADV